jgi:MFS family permease
MMPAETAEGSTPVPDAVTRHRGVRAVAVLAFGGLALIAGVDVLALAIVDRWRDDNVLAAAAFWLLVALGAVLLVGMIRSIVQIIRQPTVLRLDASGYRVSRQSGATGIRRAVWTDVKRVRRDRRDGREYVVVQLHAGGSTQIPVRAVATPRDEWIAELDDRLNRAHGQRRLT